METCALIFWENSVEMKRGKLMGHVGLMIMKHTLILVHAINVQVILY